MFKIFFALSPPFRRPAINCFFWIHWKSGIGITDREFISNIWLCRQLSHNNYPRMIIAVAATLTILEASFRIAKDWDFSWPYTDPAKILRGKDNAVETVTTWYGRKKAFLPQDEPDEIGKHLKKWFPLLPPHVTRVVEAVQ